MPPRKLFAVALTPDRRPMFGVVESFYTRCFVEGFPSKTRTFKRCLRKSPVSPTLSLPPPHVC